jgi:hypothetical protein
MLFNLLKKQTAESAAALVAKAEANLAQIKTEHKAAEQKLKDAATAYWVGTIESGETAPWTPPEALQKQINAAAHKVVAAEGVLASVRQNYENIVRAEAEKREAERQKRIKAIKADVYKAGKAVDIAITNLVDAVEALRIAQAASGGICPPEIIDHFARANLALWPVLNRKLKQAVGNFPGVSDNRLLNDAALSTFAQHLPGGKS